MKKYIQLVFLLVISYAQAQHQDKVDFIRGEITIEAVPLEKRINGSVIYHFEVLKDVDSVFLNAHNMKFKWVNLDEKRIKHYNNGKIVSIRKQFKKGDEHQLVLNYSCIPKQTVYFLGWKDEIEGNEQIWTQGQGKYTSHWLPSFDDMEEKVEFDLNITFNENYQVLANGRLTAKSNEEPKSIMWSFDMQKPMSSYLLAFAIGNYHKQELKSKTGISIENYYYPQDSLKVEPTYRYTKEIFDFLEEEIGVPYPWQNYKQIPVRDFLYAGMENTTATIFSDEYMIDSTAFVDKNYVNVNAHELAHQWFGNLVTEKDGNHHWLHEGFATYYAQLAEKEIFGDDHYYWKLFNTAKELQRISEEGMGQALTDPKASSLTFYEKGAWALVMLRDKIGDKAFKQGIKSYLKKYKFKNVTIDDFLTEMELASGANLEDYDKRWLQSNEFLPEDVKMFLMKNSSSIRMFYVSKRIFLPTRNVMQPTQVSLDFLKEDEPEEYKIALLDEFKQGLTDFELLVPLRNSSLKVRQKAIQMLNEISSLSDYPELTKPILERLLTDNSYITQELALYNLWAAYPKEKAKYLEQTKDIIGLPNKNVRLLWLTLAMLTNDYDGRNTIVYFNELSSYTGQEYGWQIRIGAFQYLNQAMGLNQESLLNLVKATNHHAWQFKKFARNLLSELLKDSDYKNRLENLAAKITAEEASYLNSKLKTE